MLPEMTVLLKWILGCVASCFPVPSECALIWGVFLISKQQLNVKLTHFDMLLYFLMGNLCTRKQFEFSGLVLKIICPFTKIFAYSKNSQSCHFVIADILVQRGSSAPTKTFCLSNEIATCWLFFIRIFDIMQTHLRDNCFKVLFFSFKRVI